MENKTLNKNSLNLLNLKNVHVNLPIEIIAEPGRAKATG